MEFMVQLSFEREHECLMINLFGQHTQCFCLNMADDES